ncbi:MAG: SurA N-terminal domain-containing protein [Betaproteobacteria bacterium]|nr:SurA N-terminal domain-containing protein [Betaproteobacteria bacterium]
MFEYIYSHKRAVQILLFLFLIPPFVFFGVDRLQSPGGTEAVATVGGYRITQQEFNQALRERQETIQRITGGRADPALLDSAELRFNVLEALVRQRLLLGRAQRGDMTITDRQLQSVIGELPAFQSEGKFSFQLYEQYLRSQGMTPAMFEAKLRGDLMLQHMDDAFGGSSFVPRTVAAHLARLSEQQREVSAATIAAEKFLPQVRLDPDAAKNYYASQQDEFRIPEQVRVEYVVLTMDALLSQVTVDPAEVRKYYADQRAEFEGREERQASHILIAVDAAATAEAKQKARAKAGEIYRQLAQKPAAFAELAKQHSQDPGSAEKGGDLGYFGRGSMPKPFEDAVFGLKPGDISPPVETQYGFHIIRLAGTRGGQTRTFEDVRGQIETELKRQRAGRKFAEVAENFNNIVFEQSETLKPAAELAKTALQQSAWITRERAPEERLNHPKLLQAIFSEEVLKNKRNTEAVEVAPGVLVAARVSEHKPSSIRPFEEVSAAIVKKLTMQQAGQLAAQDGREKLERIRQGKDAQVTWSASQLVGRAEAKGLSEGVLRQAFRVNTSRLPAYSGVDGPQGFTLIRVTRVVEPEKIPPERQKALADALRQMQGQEEMLAYVASLKQKAEVSVSRELLEKKER